MDGRTEGKKGEPADHTDKRVSSVLCSPSWRNLEEETPPLGSGLVFPPLPRLSRTIYFCRVRLVSTTSAAVHSPGVLAQRADIKAPITSPKNPLLPLLFVEGTRNFEVVFRLE